MNKSLEVSKIFLKKSFKVGLHNINNALVMALILSLFEADNNIKK